MLHGSRILLTITLELKIILQNISRRVVGSDISLSNIFLTMHLPEIFHQNDQAAFDRCEHLWVNAASLLYRSTFFMLCLSYLCQEFTPESSVKVVS